MALHPSETPGGDPFAAETEADWRVASDGTARPVFTPAGREAADDDPNDPLDAPTAAENEANETEANEHGTAARPMFTPAPRAAADEDDEDDTYTGDGPIVYEADEPDTYNEPVEAPAPAAAGTAPASVAGSDLDQPLLSGGSDLDQPLLSGDAELLARWQRVQVGFIDDPQAAVADAADLIEQAGQALVDALRQRQRQVRTLWDHGSANGSAGPGSARPDTEQLRQAMRRYRVLFDQLYPAA